MDAAKLNLESARVISPTNSIASIAKAQIGDLINPAALLTSVSQLNPIEVSFPISEGEYPRFNDKIKQHQETMISKDVPALKMILDDVSTYQYPRHFHVANR